MNVCRRAVMVVGLLVVCAMWPAGAVAGVANAGIPGAPRGNPLAKMTWGIYRGSLDGVWPAYEAAHGRARELLAKIALRPSVHWFGAWDTDATAGAVARSDIEATTGGDPNVLSQIAVFRVDPWEEAACSQVPGPSAQAGYRRWIDNFAAGIGSSRVALILQPDLPFAKCSPNRGLVLGLVAYAARRFNALPHTTVYIDAGAGDWPTVGEAVSLLERAGVRHARGFALNDTHYDSTANELRFGAAVSRGLGAAGIPGRHFIVNTAENGAPFLFYKYHFNGDPPVCATSHSQGCATLGIPPTWRTADPRWHLSPGARAIAARFADAYLWVGRPWLYQGSFPFELGRALGLARSTPF